MSRVLTWPSNAPSDPRRALLLVAGFGLAWAFLEEVVGAQMQGHYPLMQVVWWRYAVHLLALVLLFGLRRPQCLWQTRRPVYQLARSMLMLVMPLSFVLALGLRLPSDTVWSIFWIAPLLVVALARPLLGERVGTVTWATALLGLPAVVAMLAPQPLDSPWLLLPPVMMALSFSLYVVMTRTLRDEPVQVNLFYTAFGVFLALTPALPWLWVTPSWHDAVVMTAIGLVGLVALFALDRSAASAPVSAAAPMLYLQVVGVAAIGVLVHGEALTPRALAGAATLLLVAAFVWSRTMRPDADRTVPSEDPVP